MDPKHQQDLAFSHSILNYLTAAYQGRFAALNILQQLGSEGLNVDEISKTRLILEKVRRWVGDLSKQVCLFSTAWTSPETFEAQSAYKMLEDLKPELQQVANAALAILGDATTPEQPQRVKFLIASLGRYAYSRDNYIKGFIEYGKLLGSTDLVAQYEALLRDSTRDVETVHAFLTGYKNPAQVNEVFFRQLFDECVALPGLFRTHVHDVNILLAPYKGGITYERADFFGPEIAQWKDLGFDPVVAGHWRAYGFGPEESAGWLQSGFLAASIAFDWKLHGVNPMVAVAWAKNDIPAEVAARWLRAGFSADKALEMIKRGILDPEQIGKPQ